MPTNGCCRSIAATTSASLDPLVFSTYWTLISSGVFRWDCKLAVTGRSIRELTSLPKLPSPSATVSLHRIISLNTLWNCAHRSVFPSSEDVPPEPPYDEKQAISISRTVYTTPSPVSTKSLSLPLWPQTTANPGSVILLHKQGFLSRALVLLLSMCSDLGDLQVSKHN
ncbi:hypothetical protein CRENBAI_002849 [Crenichthys baileyi]|uniref:Uncharacterized protein n=1 Tax=Crenichthys baileyi TaxID=28760 RepID=A0AAV9SJ65_9TELE